MLQNDMGNTMIQDSATGAVMQLSPGFVPVGMKEQGGILYIVSANKEGKSEIGTIPSPIITWDYIDISKQDTSSILANDSQDFDVKVISKELYSGEQFLVNLNLDCGSNILWDEVNNLYTCELPDYDPIKTLKQGQLILSEEIHPFITTVDKKGFYTIDLYSCNTLQKRIIPSNKQQQFYLVGDPQLYSSNYWFIPQKMVEGHKINLQYTRQAQKLLKYSTDYNSGKLGIKTSIENISDFRLVKRAGGMVESQGPSYLPYTIKTVYGYYTYFSSFSYKSDSSVRVAKLNIKVINNSTNQSIKTWVNKTPSSIPNEITCDTLTWDEGKLKNTELIDVTSVQEYSKNVSYNILPQEEDNILFSTFNYGNNTFYIQKKVLTRGEFEKGTNTHTSKESANDREGLFYIKYNTKEEYNSWYTLTVDYYDQIDRKLGTYTLKFNPFYNDYIGDGVDSVKKGEKLTQDNINKLQRIVRDYEVSFEKSQEDDIFAEHDEKSNCLNKFVEIDYTAKPVNEIQCNVPHYISNQDPVPKITYYKVKKLDKSDLIPPDDDSKKENIALVAGFQGLWEVWPIYLSSIDATFELKLNNSVFYSNQYKGDNNNTWQIRKDKNTQGHDMFNAYKGRPKEEMLIPVRYRGNGKGSTYGTRIHGSKIWDNTIVYKQSSWNPLAVKFHTEDTRVSVATVRCVKWQADSYRLFTLTFETATADITYSTFNSIIIQISHYYNYTDKDTAEEKAILGNIGTINGKLAPYQHNLMGENGEIKNWAPIDDNEHKLFETSSIANLEQNKVPHDMHSIPLNLHIDKNMGFGDFTYVDTFSTIKFQPLVEGVYIVNYYSYRLSGSGGKSLYLNVNDTPFKFYSGQPALIKIRQGDKIGYADKNANSLRFGFISFGIYRVDTQKLTNIFDELPTIDEVKASGKNSFITVKDYNASKKELKDKVVMPLAETYREKVTCLNVDFDYTYCPEEAYYTYIDLDGNECHYALKENTSEATPIDGAAYHIPENTKIR